MAADSVAGPSSLASEASRLQAMLLATVGEAATSSLTPDRLGAEDASSLHDDRLALLQSAATVMTQLRAVSRRVNDDVRRGKRKVADARAQVDEESLALQNLKYQQRHLQEEIRTCRDFRSIYQSIPLTDLDDFRARAPAEDTSVESWADPHRLQLARLRFELTERKRLEAEKAEVQSQRASLAKENNTKKARLEGLESDLKEMLGRSTRVRQRFEEAQEADAAAAAAKDKVEDSIKDETEEGLSPSDTRQAREGDDEDDDDTARRKRTESTHESALEQSTSDTRTGTPAQTPRE